MIRRKVKRPQRRHRPRRRRRRCRWRRVRAVRVVFVACMRACCIHVRATAGTRRARTPGRATPSLSSSCWPMHACNEHRIARASPVRGRKNRWQRHGGEGGGGVEAPWCDEGGGGGGPGGRRGRGRWEEEDSLEVEGGQWPLRHREPIVEEEPSVVRANTDFNRGTSAPRIGRDNVSTKSRRGQNPEARKLLDLACRHSCQPARLNAGRFSRVTPERGVKSERGGKN